MARRLWRLCYSDRCVFCSVHMSYSLMLCANSPAAQTCARMSWQCAQNNENFIDVWNNITTKARKPWYSKWWAIWFVYVSCYQSLYKDVIIWAHYIGYSFIKNCIVFYSVHMPDPLTLCANSPAAQTCARMSWQYALHNENTANILW